MPAFVRSIEKVPWSRIGNLQEDVKDKNRQTLMGQNEELCEVLPTRWCKIVSLDFQSDSENSDSQSFVMVAPVSLQLSAASSNTPVHTLSRTNSQPRFWTHKRWNVCSGNRGNVDISFSTKLLGLPQDGRLLRIPNLEFWRCHTLPSVCVCGSSTDVTLGQWFVAAENSSPPTYPVIS